MVVTSRCFAFRALITQARIWKSFRVQNSASLLRLVRISPLISAIQRVLPFFFAGKLFYKSNRKLFSCVCIAWYKHSRGWENSRQLCKPSTSSRACTTVSNSPNPSSVSIRLCKHGNRFLLLKWCKGLFWDNLQRINNTYHKLQATEVLKIRTTRSCTRSYK